LFGSNESSELSLSAELTAQGRFNLAQFFGTY
jgi:hypothetical protein